MKEIHGDNEENDGVCRALCVVEDEIKFRESTKREREREREVQIEFRVEKSWRVRRDDADDPPGLEISPSLERDGTAAGSGGGGGSLHSSSTSPPPASRRSSIRGAPPLPRTFQ